MGPAGGPVKILIDDRNRGQNFDKVPVIPVQIADGDNSLDILPFGADGGAEVCSLEEGDQGTEAEQAGPDPVLPAFPEPPDRSKESDDCSLFVWNDEPSSLPILKKSKPMSSSNPRRATILRESVIACCLRNSSPASRKSKFWFQSADFLSADAKREFICRLIRGLAGRGEDQPIGGGEQFPLANHRLG